MDFERCHANNLVAHCDYLGYVHPSWDWFFDYFVSWLLWEQLLISGLEGSKEMLYRSYCGFSRDNRLDTIPSQATFQSRVWILSVSQLLSQNKTNCSLSVFDKENSIEFLLDFVYYLLWLGKMAKSFSIFLFVLFSFI